VHLFLDELDEVREGEETELLEEKMYLIQSYPFRGLSWEGYWSWDWAVVRPWGRALFPLSSHLR
jgi:hypothetical protein